MNTPELHTLIDLGRLEKGDSLSLILTNSGVVTGTAKHFTYGSDGTPNGVVMEVDSGEGPAASPTPEDAYFPASSIVGAVWDRPTETGE